MGQRAFDGGAPQPAEDQNEMAERGARRAGRRVDQACRGRRGDRAPDEIFDLCPAAEHLAVPAMDRGQRVDDARRRGVGSIERCHERRDGVLVADLSERFGGLIADQLVLEQRHDAGRHRGIVDSCERVERRKREKEVARLGDGGQRLHGRGRGDLAQRLDRVEPHVGVRIVERGEQRRFRVRAGLHPERQRGLNPQVCVGVAQQVHERRRHVDAGHRQQLERAAEDAEIAVAVAQRRDQRADQRRIVAAGQRLHGGPPHLPVVVAHGVVQRPDAVDRFDRGEMFDGAHPRVGAGAAKLLGERVLAIEPLGDVFDRDDQAHDVVALPERADRHALLHPVEACRRSWQADTE